MTATDDDRTLLHAYASDGDAASFAALVTRYGPMVAATARRQVRDPGRADDVAQAVFLILARRAVSIDGSLGAWLHRATLLAARNASRVDARRRHHEREATVQRSRETAATTTIDATLLDALDAALDALPTRDREVIGLRFFEALGVAEIADRLQLNAETAKKRLARATDRLRRALRGRDAASIGAAMAALAMPAGAPTFAVASTPAAHAIAKGTIGMMKQAMLTKAAILTTAAAATLGGLATIVAQQPTPAPPMPIVAAAPAKPATRPVTFALPNGVGFELLCISSSAHPGEWWTPDGTPTTPPNVHGLPERNTQITMPGLRSTTSWLIARTTTRDARDFEMGTAREVPFATRGGPTWNSVTQMRAELRESLQGGPRTSNYYLFERSGGPDELATDVEFGFVAGDWKTVVTLDPKGERVGAFTPGSMAYEWTMPALIDGRAAITAFLAGKSERQLRVIAIDADGRAHENLREWKPGPDGKMTATPYMNTRATWSLNGDDFQLAAARFDDVEPEKIVRYEIQQKTFDRVRVANIAMAPGVDARPVAQDPAKDTTGPAGTPIEQLIFDERPLEECLAIIADAGHVTIEPPPWASLQENRRDAAGPRSPVTIGLTHVTPPTAVRAALESAGVRDFMVVASPDGTSIRIIAGEYQPTAGNFRTPAAPRD